MRVAMSLTNNSIIAKPAGAAGASTTKSRSRSGHNKIAESKSTEPTATGATTANIAGEETVRSGSSSDEAKTKSKTRSRSGKRSSIFGTLRAKKEEHDEKKELKKEEKAEKKEEKADDKAIKQEIKSEEKAEKKAEKEEAKLEKAEAKEGTSTAGTLDAEGIGTYLAVENIMR